MRLPQNLTGVCDTAGKDARIANRERGGRKRRPRAGLKEYGEQCAAERTEQHLHKAQLDGIHHAGKAVNKQNLRHPEERTDKDQHIALVQRRFPVSGEKVDAQKGKESAAPLHRSDTVTEQHCRKRHQHDVERRDKRCLTRRRREKRHLLQRHTDEHRQTDRNAGAKARTKRPCLPLHRAFSTIQQPEHRHEQGAEGKARCRIGIGAKPFHSENLCDERRSPEKRRCQQHQTPAQTHLRAPSTGSCVYAPPADVRKSRAADLTQ